MSKGKKINTACVTDDQKQTIIDFMESYPYIAEGKRSVSFSNEKVRSLWQELTILLNSKPGPTREWKTWRQTWYHMKRIAKFRKLKLNLNFQSTEVGESIATSLNPHPMESFVTFDLQKPSTSTMFEPLSPSSAALLTVYYITDQHFTQIDSSGGSISDVERNVNSTTQPEQEAQITVNDSNNTLAA